MKNDTHQQGMKTSKAAPKTMRDRGVLEEPKSFPNIIAIIGGVIPVACIVALLFFPNWVGYWVFYKPLYAIFPDSLYLSVHRATLGDWTGSFAYCGYNYGEIASRE